MTSEGVKRAAAGLWDDVAGRERGSVVELVESIFDRIHTDASSINALITPMEDSALADARRIDQMLAQGVRLPLGGMPIVVKDNIDVAGVRCTRGSKWFADRIAGTDATVIKGLREAGGIVIGKASLHEFAYGGTNNNPWYGTVRNPWDTERIPGGSSGGSGAAVAAGWAAGALGTDTGGSVRCPASFAGLVGLRPTMGAVSNSGVFHIAPSFDTVGPMARRARDVATLFGATVGYDPTDPQSVVFAGATGCWNSPPIDFSGLRVGVPHEYFLEETEPEIVAAVLALAEVFRELGAEVIDDCRVPLAAEAREVASTVIKAEALSIHVERLERDRERFGEDVARRLSLGYELSGWRVAQLYHELLRLQRELQGVFAGVDVVLTPTAPNSPGKIAESEMIATTAQVTRFTYPWSVAHVPAISLPCGFTSEGLPIGAQLVGPAHSDLFLLALAERYQALTDWHTRVAPHAQP